MPLIVFDLDGTLLDSRKSILASIRHAFRSIGHPDILFDEKRALQQDLATTLRETGRALNLDFPDATVLAFIREYRSHHTETAAKHSRLYPGVREILARLRKNFLVALATTKHTEQAQTIVAAYGISDFFCLIQGTEPGIRYKPAPDILHTVLRKLGEDPCTAAYVGDSPHDITAARHAHLRQIACTYGYGERNELERQNPDWMIHALSDFVWLEPLLLETLSPLRRLPLRADFPSLLLH